MRYVETIGWERSDHIITNIQVEQIVIDLENRIGEAYGLSKSICKSLNKLGFYDKEHKLIWANVQKMEEVLKNEEQMD